MSLDVAFVREQHVSFAVVVVRRGVIASTQREQIGAAFQLQFRVPVVLMEHDFRGRPTYWGRRDLVEFLASISPTQLPWRRVA